jgi:hypothetical protein
VPCGWASSALLAVAIYILLLGFAFSNEAAQKFVLLPFVFRDLIFSIQSDDV